MKLLDALIEELNKDLTDEQKASSEKFERLHSEQYQIITDENGKHINQKGGK